MRLKECSRRVVLIWKKPEPVKYCQDHINHTDETESTNNESTNNESVPEKMEERESRVPVELRGGRQRGLQRTQRELLSHVLCLLFNRSPA